MLIGNVDCFQSLKRNTFIRNVVIKEHISFIIPVGYFSSDKRRLIRLKFKCCITASIQSALSANQKKRQKKVEMH